MKLKGLIFDLDGVITDTAHYHFVAWKNLAKQLNIEIDEDFNENLKGISRIESLELILKKGNIADKFSEEEKESLADKKNLEYVELIKHISPNNLLPGIKKLLDSARDKKLKMAIASASRNAPTILKRLEIEEYFDVIVNPETVKNGKPSPDIFIKATELLQIQPSQAIGIEDALSGVQAINAANIFSVAVGESEELKIADIHYPNTSYLILEDLIHEFDQKLH